MGAKAATNRPRSIVYLPWPCRIALRRGKEIFGMTQRLFLGLLLASMYVGLASVQSCTTIDPSGTKLSTLEASGNCLQIGDNDFFNFSFENVSNTPFGA